MSGAGAYLARRAAALRLAPDGLPRPDAPFGRGPLAARVLRGVIELTARAVAALPADTAHAAARAGGMLEWALRPGKRAVLAENLSHALGLPPEHPEVRRTVQREVVNEARRSVDLLWAVGRPGDVMPNMRFEDPHDARSVLREGRGMIIAGAHLGGWEVVVQAPRALLGRRTTIVARDDWLAWAVDPIRVRSGLDVSYLGATLAPLAKALRRGDPVLLLADVPTDAMRLHTVPFLDAAAELPAGPAVLARLTGAPIVPLAVLPIAPRSWRILLGRPIPAPARRSGEEGEREVTAAMAAAWSEMLRAHPEHWAAVYPMRWRPLEEALTDGSRSRSSPPPVPRPLARGAAGPAPASEASAGRAAPGGSAART